MIRFCAILFSLLFAGVTHGTTWGTEEVDDPLIAGAKCSVESPMSFGGYIYQWPSKYDQVFWPMTEESGIWFCEKSGFTAFIGDFGGLTDTEREAIRIFLAGNFTGNADIRKKLELLDGIYKLRNKDNRFRNMLLRVLARWHQDLEEYEKANEYRRIALEQIRAQLKGELPEQVRLEYLYVACNYEVFLEGLDPERCVGKVRDALDSTSDDELSGYAEYLKELIEETPKIKPGNKIDPENSDS
jgi:hypothetical protein